MFYPSTISRGRKIRAILTVKFIFFALKLYTTSSDKTKCKAITKITTWKTKVGLNLVLVFIFSYSHFFISYVAQALRLKQRTIQVSCFKSLLEQ